MSFKLLIHDRLAKTALEWALVGALAAAIAVVAVARSAPAAGSLALDGPFVQGGLVQGRTEPGSLVTFEGRPVRVTDDGVFLIAFHRDEPRNVTLQVKFPDGRSERRDFSIEQREYNVQRIDGLPPRKVTPSEEDMVRIREEIKLVKAARDRNDDRADFLSGYQWPTTGRISGVYGSQRILNGEPRQPHFGVDIAAPVGTLVLAPADGIVTLTHPDMYFSGGTLILDHGHGLSSSFLHLDEILVEEGDRVTRGTAIAKVGATGRVTGAHLDWRMNWFDRRIDPSLLVGPMPAE